MTHNFVNLSGKTFGLLTVLYRDATKSKNTYWICRCSCELGTIKSIRGSHLKAGRIQSCGCLYNKKRGTPNAVTYESHDDHYIGYCNTKQFYFDHDEYDWIKEHNWYFDKDGYVCATINGKGKKMHRVIMGAEDGIVVDHIDRNKANNLKGNLRFATEGQNNINTDIYSNNTTGITGVYRHGDRWISKIGFGGEQVFLGTFDSIEEAADARLLAEVRLYGEFSPNLNYAQEMLNDRQTTCI